METPRKMQRARARNAPTHAAMTVRRGIKCWFTFEAGEGTEAEGKGEGEVNTEEMTREGVALSCTEEAAAVSKARLDSGATEVATVAAEFERPATEGIGR